jgi:microcystin-dependent protein
MEERVTENFIGEIRVFSFDWAPQGWALCNGAIMQIQQNQALYSLLQTQFGGDGSKTYGLPDLRGRTPVYGGGYQGARNAGGVETVALTVDSIPPHVHTLYATTNNASSTSATNAVLAVAQPDKSTPPGVWPIYSAASTTGALIGKTVSSVGGSEPHNNMQPYTVVNYCIALSGFYPTRD